MLACASGFAEPAGQPLERFRAVWSPWAMICEDVGVAHLE